MRKSYLQEYTAPEMEVLSTVVEGGFTVSGYNTIELASEEDYGEF